MQEDRDHSGDVAGSEGPEKDPRSADQPTREEGKQNALVHEGAEADARPDTNEDADSRVRIEQPDGDPVPHAKE